MRTLVFTFGLSLLALGSGAQAAAVTWADGAGTCAGNSPCFTTLAAAVANSGPAPAQVFVFPGTYAESVDLGTMGSALPGGVAGNLSIISVDLSGQPAPGAVVDPGASGGPGTGAALFATGFPGTLLIDGLEVRSPDDSGVSLTGGDQGVRLMRLVASNCVAGNGIVVANQAGVLEVDDSQAVLNFNSGFFLGSETGTVEVNGSSAERNQGPGFTIVANDVVIDGSRADFNGQEGWLVTPFSDGGALTLNGVSAQGNAEDGFFVLALITQGIFSTGTATGLDFRGNGTAGARIFAETLVASQLVAEDNGDSGLFVGGRTVQVSQVEAHRNGDGGLVALAELEVRLDTVSAHDNTGAGVAAGFPGGSNPGGSVFVNAVSADGNTEQGVLAAAATVFASQVTAVGNQTSSGAIVLGGELVEGEFLTAQGNQGVGLFLMGDDLALRDSLSTGNVTGVAAVALRAVIERTNASLNGPGSGNLVDGVGFGVSSRRFEVQDSTSELNEVGWLFFNLGAPLASALEAPVTSPESDLGAFDDAMATILARLQASDGAVLAGPRTILTSRTLSNSVASMVVALPGNDRLRVSCSDFVSNGPSGLELQTDLVVDARYNYWGDANGPTHPGNPAGSGDLVLDGPAGGMGLASWDPFLGVPAAAEDCPAVVQPLEVPVLPRGGLLLLAVLLASAAVVVMRR
ncbi:MAG: hypothetical protein AAF604_12310 [Acidobacteriota bacterium]